MDLVNFLRSDLAGLMKRRDKVALRAIRDVIGAIENAEVTHLLPQTALASPSSFVAGAVPFGQGDKVVKAVAADEQWAIATAQIDRRLEEARTYREAGRIDEALMAKAEALVIDQRLKAFTAPD